jgi:peptide/nickel transport system permease protein
MTVFLIRRISQSILVILLMSFLVFAGVFIIGDPIGIMAPPEATEMEKQAIRASLGLDKPWWNQYIIFMKNAFQGDLGKSFVQNKSAIKLILERFPATMELAFLSLLIAILTGIPLGMFAGLKPDSILSRIIMGGSILGFSLPTFWVGLLLIMTFSVLLGWLPSMGRGEIETVLGVRTGILTWDGFKHLLLPAINLALFVTSMVLRLVRAGTREVVLQDYVRFARAKGVSRARVIWVHILKNILIPVVTVLGLEFGNLIAFSVVTETVFAWPGMGRFLIESIYALDRPVVVAYLVMTVLLFTIINLVVDILYSLLDPRIRLEEKNI